MARDVEPTVNQTSVQIEFFFEKGCSACMEIENWIIPQLEEMYSGFYQLLRYDISDKNHYLKLISYQDQFKIKKNESVSMVLNQTCFLNGQEQIEKDLFSRLDYFISTADEMHRSIDSEEILSENKNEKFQEVDLLENRYQQFTLGGILLAGLVDGLNPCAISTMVFFVSLLFSLKASRSILLGVGISFCLSSFLTYFLLGFGLFQTLHAFSGFGALQKVIEWGMVCFLILLAVLSLKDALMYAKDRSKDSILIQLPDRLKIKIHQIMRKGLSQSHIILSSFLVGITVTVIESVCTGQVYVPTLVFLIKTKQNVWGAIGYLLLYNLMFIVPMGGSFIFLMLGSHRNSWIEFSKNHVVPAKVLMAVFFLLMALFLLPLK